MTARLVMKLRVQRAAWTTLDVLHLTLTHPLRPGLPAWTAGAHVDLRLPDGRVRQYSLCGDPADLARYEIAIKREDAGRGASRWAHANMAQVGTIAHVSAPRNNFPLAEGARRHVLIGGGIGVTPLASMARVLAASGADFIVHLCARSAAEAPLLAELEHVCGDRLVRWFSAEGRRFKAAILGTADEGTHIYACGPRTLLDAVFEGTLASGWSDDRIHAEVFQATLDENFKPEPFDVRIASTGEVLHVPADRSILDVLRSSGRTVPSSCELGICGSCICSYCDGTVIHRDAVISLAERQDRLALCVSRARVAVTLDL